MSELINKSISEVQAGLRNKEFSCVELTSAYLQRIASVDDKVKSFITIFDEAARSQAQVWDDKINNGDSLPSLMGIPGAIKDVLATRGELTTGATNILYNYKAPYDATVVKRLLDSGFIDLGKVNCDAFAHGASTENSDYFVTHNPWDLERVPGGSSGGSAASVSARQALFSLGTDTGGSTRYPAAFCGVVGLKPTYGRNSRYGLFSMCSSTDTVGILARRVGDVAAVLKSIAGHDPKDATSSKEAVADYFAALQQADLKGVRIGVPKEYFVEGLNPDVEKLVRASIKDMEAQGAEIIEVSLPNTEYGIAAYYILMSSEVSSNLARFDGIKYGYSIINDKDNPDQAKDLMEVYTKSRKYGLGQEAKRRIMLGTYSLSSGYFDQYYHKAAKVRALIKQDFVNIFSKIDFIATPVSAHPAFKIGAKSSPLEMYLEDAFMSGASLAGLPAISLPCGFVTEDGKKLPVGMQLIGNYFKEEALLQAAHSYEKINNWSEQIAPVV